MAPHPPRATLGRIPLAVPTLCVAVGAWIGRSAPALPWLLVPLVLVLLLAPRARIAAAGLLLGLLLGSHAATERRKAPSLREVELPAVYILRGHVRHTELPAWRAQRFTLALTAIGDPPVALAAPRELHVTLRLTGRGDWRWHDLVPGSEVMLLARVSRRRQGLRAVVTDRRGVHVLARGEGGVAELARRRRHASWALARQLEGRDAGLARALLLGDRARLDRRDRTLFRGTGQAHLLAVSGLHVGLLVGGFVCMLRLLGIGLRATWIAGIVLAAVYVPFTGAPPSAVRAGLGAIAWFVGALLSRAPRGLAVLVLVGLIVIISDPQNLESVSFQLSFAAVTSILLLAERLRALLVRQPLVLPGHLPRKRAPVRTALSVSLAAWIGTAPLVALHIGRLCPAGPFLAVPAVPLTAALLGSGFCIIVADGAPLVQAVAAACFHEVASLLRELLDLARQAHLGARPAFRPTPAWLTLYAAAFVLAARTRGRWMVVGFASLLILLVALLLPVAAPGLTAERENAPSATYDAGAVILADLPAEPAVASTGLFLPLAMLALAAFAALSVRLRWLKPGGAIAAWLLGSAAAWTFGFMGIAALLAPFLVATLLGKLPGAERSGARSLRQVLCNGVPAFLGIVIAHTWRAPSDVEYGDLHVLLLGYTWFLGALSCLGADTCATEIGVRFGGRPFRLTGGRTEPGASGGVTAAGLLGSLFGAFLAPAVLWILIDPEFAFVLTIAGAGFLAALLDSLLGGTVQFRGRVAETGEATEDARRADTTIERVSGVRWLDNDAVNLLTGVAGGALAVALTYLAP